MVISSLVTRNRYQPHIKCSFLTSYQRGQKLAEHPRQAVLDHGLAFVCAAFERATSAFRLDMSYRPQARHSLRDLFNRNRENLDIS